MPGHYDPLLVALSYVVAVFGGYVALDLAHHARGGGGMAFGSGRPASGRSADRRNGDRSDNKRLASAALALGAGIWSMHFIGMLAYRSDMPIGYDAGLTALSFLLAVAVSGAGLFAVARNRPRRFTLTIAGTLTGLGIVSMHYVGMAGMRMDMELSYDIGLVAASVAIAIIASVVALWLAFRTRRPLQRAAGAVLLGLGVVTMHYTGMAAAGMEPVTQLGALTFDGANADRVMPASGSSHGIALSSSLLAIMTGAGALLLLSLAMLSSLLDRRQQAEQSAEQEARYRAIVDTAVDPIVLINDHGIVESFNHAAEKTFGYRADEVIGRNVSMLMPEPYRGAHDGYLDRYHRTGERRIVGIGREVEGLRKDGSTFPLDLSVGEWHVGKRRMYTGIMRDITARKAAEEAILRARDEAEAARIEALQARDDALRADRAKTKFLAAASHDLRQPLQSLFFFAHALSDKLENHPTAPLLASMTDSLNGLRVMLDSLLDVSRLDAGVVKPSVTDFALGPLLDRLAEEYRNRAAESGLALRHVATSAWTRSDPALLERILRNLIENAIRYTERGDILVGCLHRADGLRLAVLDQGIGIPADKTQDIFLEFTQLANPERDRRKGLGLGLAIVRRLARLLEHGVTVRSTPGRGSGFFLDLPVAVPRPVPKPARCPAELPDTKGLIVVVDDDTIILLSMRAMLEEWGYEVVAAVSADEAIASLLNLGRQPAMIVADYRLREGRTGVEAIRDIYGVCGVRVPAVVLTGDTDPARIAEVQRSGHRLVHKPVSAPMLREILNTAA
ncbi:two-component hybrid sensor and regulator [Azospirillum sp. B510]|uniref:hybrid sensor histidine kinase/response regulator n=1 Tax=Azospirillum sp. (strain B510) TaxID=137722 RepID=UPI0001C4C2F9|nr:MHYT domain-containing protein [Azospirillum sp. B510]BAI71982.1 two-component hybrid sensor and regulator [Azospirillum sp. B510]